MTGCSEGLRDCLQIDCVGIEELLSDYSLSLHLRVQGCINGYCQGCLLSQESTACVILYNVLATNREVFSTLTSLAP